VEMLAQTVWEAIYLLYNNGWQKALAKALIFNAKLGKFQRWITEEASYE